MKRTDETTPNFGMYIFECVMSVLYLAVAYALLATNIFKETLPKEIRIALGALFIAYGIFRVIRVVRKGLKMRKE